LELALVFPQLLPLEANSHLAAVLLVERRYSCGVAAGLFSEGAMLGLELLMFGLHLVILVSLWVL
jgi:hypothetical protein